MPKALPRSQGACGAVGARSARALYMQSALGAVGLVLVAALAAACADAPPRPDLLRPPMRPPDRAPPEPPAHVGGGITAQFLGTASVALGDGETTILTDGFFSRPGPLRVWLGKVGPDEARIDAALSRAGLKQICGVFVAHSHYDHAMDSAVVARKTGARLLSSASTAQIAAGEGFPQARMTIIPAVGDRTYECGAFAVTVVSSPHSPDDRYPGHIVHPLHAPAKVGDYKVGESFAFLVRHNSCNIVIQSSANASPGLYRGVKAAVVFLSIGGLGGQDQKFVETYWREVVRTTGAKLVVPIHWDDFTRGLDKPLKPIPPPFDHVDASLRRIKKLAAADKVELRILSPFQHLKLPERCPD